MREGGRWSMGVDVGGDAEGMARHGKVVQIM